VGATTAVQLSPEVELLFVRAFDEVSQKLPELKAAVMELQAASFALLDAIQDGDRDRFRGAGKRYTDTSDYLYRQLPLLEDRTSDGRTAPLKELPEPLKLQHAEAQALPDVGPTGDEELTKPKTGMRWQEAAERMERLRAEGERFTSQHKLAAQLGCSSGTINKAIRETSSLKAWAERKAATPRAQSLNDVATDRTEGSREANPADEAAIREHLEREDLTPDERAFFNGLSRDDQLDFLDDPDQHSRILGRKP
jgi:hypothetical protein